MAQQQSTISIAAPGFRGINTNDSPTQLSAEWAQTATNAVVDEFGRIGARKGQNVLTTDVTALSSNPIETIHEFLALDSSTTILSCGNNKIFTGTTTLTDVTGAATITANDWSVATLNDECFFFQANHTPLVYRASTGTLIAVTAHPSYAATVPQGDIVRSAYGRLWVAGVANNKSTVYWSDLQIGAAWSGGSSGSIDVSKFWPDGADEVVDIVAHNGYLFIFGRHNILVYSGADDTPASNLTLEDSISGIGAAQRDTAFVVGTDVWFVDVSGVRSLGRTIQEKSVPIGDVSKNVRKDFKTFVANEDTKMACCYFPEEALYIVNFVEEGFAFVFDTRAVLEDGSARTTVWQLPSIYSFEYGRDGVLYMGNVDGISDYSGYTDDGSTYKLTYYTHYLDFDSPTQLKFPKSLEYLFIGGSGQDIDIKWAYDYKGTYKGTTDTLAAGAVSEYNVAEYNIAEYTASIIIDDARGKPFGSGRVVSVGFEIDVAKEVSLQEINIRTLIGRIT